MKLENYRKKKRTCEGETKCFEESNRPITKSKRKSEKYLETNEKWNQNSSIYMGCIKKNPKREVYNSTGLPQETNKQEIK